ncbi:MAG: extracellular solute-binding protein [Caldilineaceae bacterium]|nr:extracellular solute-binding protein [Caldilineaceae bacterium]
MRVSRNRFVVVFVACGLILSLILSACAGAPMAPATTAGEAEAGAAQTVVTFRSWSPIQETTAKMIAAFEAANPDIKIEPNITNYPEYLIDLKTKAASGDMPDIIGLEPGALTQEYRDFLMPLQDCAVKSWGENWQDAFYPIGIDQARLGNPAGDENFYGLPMLDQTINLWYTVPIFEQAGVEPPETYDEMLSLAQMFNEQGIAPLMVGAGDGWLRRDIYMQLIHNIAPGLIYKAEVGEASFTDPEFVEAMTWWKRLFDDQIIQPGALGLSAYPDSMELIESGQAAMFPMGAWWQQQATRPNPPELSQGFQGYAPFLFPDVTGAGRPEDPLGGIDVMLGVTKSAKDPDAACRVLADFISGDAAQELINTFNDLPAVRGMEPAAFETDHQREVWRLLTEDWMPKVQYARQLRDPNVKQALEDALAAVAAGEMTPEQGMQLVQDAWTPPQ